jgi:hypothetical protein
VSKWVPGDFIGGCGGPPVYKQGEDIDNEDDDMGSVGSASVDKGIGKT